MIESLFRILALIRKEMLAMFKDPKSRVSLILPPILQCLIFGYAATYDLNNVPYALVDHDRSAVSRALVARLDGSGIFTPRCDARSGRAGRRRSSTIGARSCSSSSSTGISRRQPARRSAGPGPGDRRRPQFQYRRHRARLRQRRSLAEFGAGMASLARAWPRPRVRVTTRAWYNPSLETRWNMIPSLIGTITMMMTMMLTAMSVAREREEGTFDQLLVTPFRPTEIMIGKAVPSMMVGPDPIDPDLPGGAVLVSDPVLGLLSHPLSRARPVPVGCRRYRPVPVVDRRQHAAGDDLHFRVPDAVHAAVGPDRAHQQHAGGAAVPSR